MALVSVITPFYDGNKFIAAWQNSLSDNENYLRKMNQEHGTSHSMEVILVNDSPRIEPVIMGINAGKKNWRMVVNRENIGIHASRVRGLSVANGSRIIFLDQDDILRYDAVWAFLEADEKCEDENSIFISNALMETGDEKVKLVRTPAHKKMMWDFNTYITVGTQIMSPGQCLIRKELIPDFWKENILKNNGSDDFFLWLLMMKSGVKGVFIDETLYRHRDTGGNLSADTESTDLSCFEFIDLLSGKGIIEEKDLERLRKTLSVKSSFRKSGTIKKLATAIAHPGVVGSNAFYKTRTKTPYGFGRTKKEK